CRLLHAAPPRNAFITRGIGEAAQEIAVAGERRAPAHEIAAAQLVERTEQLMLVNKPALVLRDDGRAAAGAANPERIAPPTPATDVDGARGDACVMLVENPAHRSLLISRCGDGRPDAAQEHRSPIAVERRGERLAR